MTNPSWAETVRQAVDELMGELTGLFEPAALVQRTATVLARHLDLPLTSFALLDEPLHVYAMTGTHGARTAEFPAIRLRGGQGLGGRAVADRVMFTVEDYATDERISDHFRSIVSAEHLRGMAAAPVLSQGVPIGILYGARREVGRPSDRALDTLDAVAKAIAPVLAASMGAEKQARLRVSEERQRLAGTLHDDVAQLLFSINSSARRARELERGDLSQRQVMERIQQEAQQATDRLRDVLEALAPSTTLERVPAAAQQDIDAFKERTGIPAYLILRGSMVALCPLAERVLTSCVRQVLFNIEQHANATLVVVTLDYQPDGTHLVVQDDGRGVPQGFDVPAVPSGAHHWGLTSITRHVEQLGGSVSLEAAEDGGARFRAWVPLARGDEASGPPTVGRR